MLKLVEIRVFSRGGLKNLDDEALFAAVVQYTCARVPDADVIGLTVNPQDTEIRHVVPTFPMARWDDPTTDATVEESSAYQSAGTFLSRWKERLKGVPGTVRAVQGLRGLKHLA